MKFYTRSVCLLIISLTIVNCCLSQTDVNEILQRDIEKENKEKNFFKDLQKPTPIEIIQPAPVPPVNTIRQKKDQQVYNKEQSKDIKTVDQILEEAANKYNSNQAKVSTEPNQTVNKNFNSSSNEYPEKIYAQGVYGYDVTKTLEENKNVYTNAGYNYSTRIKDSTIYKIVAGIGLLLIIVSLIVYRIKNYHNNFKTEK